MELRDIEIFLTLAEELHFGRTAERLHVTPSRVSQAIRKQERRIGTTLFERNNRMVRLTPIGQKLYDDLRVVHRGLNESLARASMAARGKTDVLRLGMIGGFVQGVLRPLFDAFAAERPVCEIQIRNVGLDNPFGPLRSGEADVELLWLPVDEPDLTVGPVIYTEPVVLAMSAAHPLATRDSVSYEVLGDEVVMGGCAPDYWRESLVPAVTPTGRPIPIGPRATNFLDMLPILSTGEAMSPVPVMAAQYYSRPDIAYVPIHDAPATRWAVVWRTSAETDLVRAFARAAGHG